MHESKQEKLSRARAHVESITKEIKKSLDDTKASILKYAEKLRHSSTIDQYVERQILQNARDRKEQLLHLERSPYFFRCDAEFDDRDGQETFFISKYGYSEKNIYSWTSRVAALRFENIGEASYALRSGQSRRCVISRKDQFMITDGAIKFMSSEEEGSERELIHQEHLTNRKAGFVLPEIIAKMEKLQDDVVRAHHEGSFLIAGPAGSGKTTLALHRVAYLAQSPDTAEKFPPESMVVFVQDDSTKDYFSAILPELGINRVKITTFSEWALAVVGLSGYSSVYRFGKNEKEKDEFEFAKNKALRNISTQRGSLDIRNLESFYHHYLNERQMLLFKEHIAGKLLDRFDLAILLRSKLGQDGGFFEKKRVIVERRGRTFLADRYMPFSFNLIVVDEVQNYLKEELEAIKACSNKETNAIVYVGDLAQQTKLCTLRSWNEIGETFYDSRKAVLDKVYRNTKQILGFIKNIGYRINIPDEIREGEPVVQKVFTAKQAEIDFVFSECGLRIGDIIGILSQDDGYLADYRLRFKGSEGVRIYTVNEAQGVEFDAVFLVGQLKDRTDTGYADMDLRTEKNRVEKDLLYVALTRAMNALYVLYCDEGKRYSLPM